MTVGTKGSILWIILLQSRHFALGELDVLCKFLTMHNDLQAKRAVIQHGECPAELLTNSLVPSSDTNTSPKENNDNTAPLAEKKPRNHASRTQTTGTRSSERP